MANVEKHTEFETKYRVDASVMMRFKRIMAQYQAEFRYVEGPDDYFVKPDTNSFKRYRHATYPKDAKKEITTKIKPEGAKHNIQRRELNLDVTFADPEVVKATIEDDGFAYNFTVFKSCHIFDTEDASVTFYSVVDITPGEKHDEEHLIEIEVAEDLVSQITESQAWDIINKYEKALAAIGVNPQKRLKLSIFESYRR
jgi:adenylate cyclase class IV